MIDKYAIFSEKKLPEFMKICTEFFQTLRYVRAHCTVCLSVLSLFMCSCVKLDDVCDAEEFFRDQLFLCFILTGNYWLKELFYYLYQYDSDNKILNRLNNFINNFRLVAVLNKI